jgi:hypothetical protein
MRPAKSGWSALMPVSSTATFTPWPVSPAAHAAGAPICGALTSRKGLWSRSSQTASTPSASAALFVPASADQIAAGSRLGARIAAPPMLVSGRIDRAPAAASAAPRFARAAPAR